MPTESQHYHYVPRFILRNFESPNPSMPKGKGKGRKKAHVEKQDVVHCFDLGTGKLELRPIAKTYGIVNLYKDVKNLGDARRLEDRLSTLEDRAASIIEKTLDHDSLGRGCCQVEREDVDILRKILQIMCYRKHTLSPDDAPPKTFMGSGGQFFKNLKNFEAPDTAIKIWAHCLAYLLEAPHDDLVKRARYLQQKVDVNATFRSIFDFCRPANIAPEDLIANDYHDLACQFYLGVVEAADGAEFTMSDNSFGLCEGTIDQAPNAHCLFIVSPRVALILRSKLIDDDFSGPRSIIVRSALSDIPIERADICFSNGRATMNLEALLRHRASSAYQHDEVHFKIIKLTERQTQNVNAVVLFNAKKDGSVTFLSKDAMRNTLDKYLDIKDPFIVDHRNRYAPLRDQLNDGVVGSEDVPAPSPSSRNPQPNRTSHPFGAGFKKNKRINALLNDISAGKVSCQSDYDRARQVYEAASREENAGMYVLVMVENLLPLIVHVTSMITEEVIRSRKEIVRVNPFGTLVKTLPASESAKVMGTFRELIPDVTRRYGDPEVDDILNDAIIFGLLNALVKKCAYVLPLLIPEVPGLVQSE